MLKCWCSRTSYPTFWIALPYSRPHYYNCFMHNITYINMKNSPLNYSTKNPQGAVSSVLPQVVIKDKVFLKWIVCLHGFSRGNSKFSWIWKPLILTLVSFYKNKYLISILIKQKRCFISTMVEERCFFHILVPRSPLVIYQLSRLKMCLSHMILTYSIKGLKIPLIHSPASTVAICTYHGSTSFHIFQ